jgi:Uma2 family endonuclease
MITKPKSSTRAGERLDAFVPPLEPGDHLTRAEFERRYEAMPNLKKAELIEGIVYMQAAVRMNHHGRPHYHLVTWLGYYEAHTPGVLGADNTSARLDLENEPQPDAMMLIAPKSGGQATISEDDYVENAPELVCEVSSSTVSIDLHAKFRVYQRNRVREYIVWRVLDREIDWFVLRAGKFQRLRPDSSGVLRGKVFPGLWLDAPAIMRGDLAAVLKTLDAGLDSQAHKDFVKRLGRKGTRR